MRLIVWSAARLRSRQRRHGAFRSEKPPITLTFHAVAFRLLGGPDPADTINTDHLAHLAYATFVWLLLLLEIRGFYHFSTILAESAAIRGNNNFFIQIARRAPHMQVGRHVSVNVSMNCVYLLCHRHPANVEQVKSQSGSTGAKWIEQREFIFISRRWPSNTHTKRAHLHPNEMGIGHGIMEAHLIHRS